MRAALLLLIALTPAIAPADDVDHLQIHFDDLSARDASHERGFRALQGVEHRPLEGAAFYEVVGRPDLAARYRFNEALRWTLLGTGAAAAIGGGLAIALEGTRCERYLSNRSITRDVRSVQTYCIDQKPLELYAAAAITGIGALVAGLLLDPHPVDAAGAFRLAEAYNRDLRTRSGLATLDLGLSLQPGGAGISIAGAY